MRKPKKVQRVQQVVSPRGDYRHRGMAVIRGWKEEIGMRSSERVSIVAFRIVSMRIRWRKHGCWCERTAK